MTRNHLTQPSALFWQATADAILSAALNVNPRQVSLFRRAANQTQEVQR